MTSQNGWPLRPPLSTFTPGSNSDARLTVARDTLPLFLFFCTQFDLRVENLELAGPEDEWGYAHRPIAGTNVWSNHASGTAVDLNATRHPYGRRGTFNNTQVGKLRAVLKECGGLLVWGGDWSTPDEMHFEVKRGVTAATIRAWHAARVDQPPPTTSRPVLRRGSTGDSVRELQRVLNAWYPRLRRLAVDGVFGPLTEERVRYLQTRANIAVDGIVGPQTWRVLGFA